MKFGILIIGIATLLVAGYLLFNSSPSPTPETSPESADILTTTDEDAGPDVVATDSDPVLDGSVEVQEQEVDLNQDGQLEVMTREISSIGCGASNCPTKVETQDGIILLEVVAQSIPKVLETKTNGYSDLQFGPSATGTVTTWSFDGTSYQAQPTTTQ